jgi:DMSO/TMAO reductase YedYZ molybdopterin-dependent catalytic subunit
MSKQSIISRREAIMSGLAAMGGLILPGCTRVGQLPPTYGNILRMGDALTYAAHRSLLPGQSLVREYSHRDISSFPATGTINPGDTSSPYHSELYARLHHNNFSDWRLSVEGLVSRPGLYSLEDLMRLPSKSQITRHTCEEGWTAIAEWKGVTVRRVLEASGILPAGRYVSFYAFDGFEDCIDMIDALHPQTILAYGMNGKQLPVPHGAPVRLRLETQIGYKSMKYLQRIVVKERFDDHGKNGSIQNGWSWYNGI